MATELRIGIQTNGIKHGHADPMPDIDTRFRMVKESGAFDYVDKTPASDEVEAFLAAREKYDLPIRTGGWFYTLGRDEDLLFENLALSGRLGSIVHNVQVMSFKEDGALVSNAEVVDFYERALVEGDRHGVHPCLEVHVNMWSEDFRRVEVVGRMIEERGLPFRMTLDHSHVIFKIDNPEEQEVFDIKRDIESGKLVLDPFQSGSICQTWIDAGWVRHCHARAAVPNNPKNSLARDENGKVGRGIQYPFSNPGEGNYHEPWDGSRLEPWKEVIRQLMRHHATDDTDMLGQISTEFIPNFDYGEGCRYSLFEQSMACAIWMRDTWNEVSGTV
ncbi:MAG: hypothetical protein CMM47_09290 [Rhodospirillaceae bacterium]|nr:hypothetical protein [Rhodospirillaceae bacterium]